MLVRQCHSQSRGRGRAGVTLTEILISIMIMGVGMISLATLFPLGLIRLRNAQRMTRSGYLVESAASDLSARNLLAKTSFTSPFFSPWNVTTNAGRFDPWIQDTPKYGIDWGTGTMGAMTPVGAYRGYGGNGSGTGFTYRPGPGLPVAYDPLWRAVAKWTVGSNSVEGIYPDQSNFPEARFGDGSAYLRSDPNAGGTSTLPSAHGLQRLSNLQTYPNTTGTFPWVTVTAAQAFSNKQTIFNAFVSPEDIVFQDPRGEPLSSTGGVISNPSPVVPDLSNVSTGGGVESDWRFSWMFTGQQTDASNGSVYDGDIVIFENRQFGLDVVNGVTQAAGETVVEAIWGYSGAASAASYPYATGGDRVVLLRWPATMPDPDVKVGGWLADVTYERWYAEDVARGTVPASGGGTRFSPYPLQRCYWYQVAKKSEAVSSPPFSAPQDNNYRQMTVWTTTPLRARTPLSFAAGGIVPYHVEAALVVPSVVNVFPRTVYTR